MSLNARLRLDNGLWRPKRQRVFSLLLFAVYLRVLNFDSSQGASVEELAAAFQKADKLYSSVREEINAMRLLNHV
jgi:hypothetical protein